MIRQIIALYLLHIHSQKPDVTFGVSFPNSKSGNWLWADFITNMDKKLIALLLETSVAFSQRIYASAMLTSFLRFFYTTFSAAILQNGFFPKQKPNQIHVCDDLHNDAFHLHLLLCCFMVGKIRHQPFTSPIVTITHQLRYVLELTLCFNHCIRLSVFQLNNLTDRNRFPSILFILFKSSCTSFQSYKSLTAINSKRSSSINQSKLDTPFVDCTLKRTSHRKSQIL